MYNNDPTIRYSVACGKPATTFKDQISKQGYAISGLCQLCQDSIF